MADRPKPEPHGREQLQHLSRLTTPPLPREPLAWDLAASTDAASKTDEPRPPVDVPGLDLLMPIGSGSYGTVWIARNREVGMCQACKLIPPDCAAELDGLRGLVTRVPPHDALMPIHHVARVGDWIYCTMPLADDAGTRTPDLGDRPYVALTLAEYIRRHGRRPAAEVARIGAELAGGLDHLRMHGVKHGDVKPSNIARHRGLWRLMDYGLVHELSAKVGACTAAYSAPEGPGHPTADEYALGLVLAAMLRGTEYRKPGSDPIPEVVAADPASHDLVRVVRRMTAHDPCDRFGGTGNLPAALRAIARSLEKSQASGAKDADSTQTDSPSNRMSPGRRRVVVASFAFAGAVVTSAALLRPHERTIDPDLAHPGSASASPAPADVAADTPARLTDLDVLAYAIQEGEDGALERSTGVSLTAGGPVPLGGATTLHAHFDRPMHAYLIAFDVDGRVWLRYPADLGPGGSGEARSDLSPPAATALDYPENPGDPSGPGSTRDAFLYRHPSGLAGVQGFVLLASESPLPPWSEWVAERWAYMTPWSDCLARAADSGIWTEVAPSADELPRWCPDDETVESLTIFDHRGRTAYKGGPAVVRARAPRQPAPVEWARSLEGFDVVAVVLFPVG